jgi:hypothetical protein
VSRTQITPDDAHRRPGYRAPLPTGMCEFRRFIPAAQWTVYGVDVRPVPPKEKRVIGRNLRGPAYGDAPRNAPLRRCPLCNRRLRLKARFCVGGEFVRWEIPDHKPRETRKPGPRRASRRAGRGK